MSATNSKPSPENLSHPPASERAVWLKFYASSNELVNEHFGQALESELRGAADDLLPVEDENWGW